MTTKTQGDHAAFPRPSSVDTELGTLADGDVVVEALDGLTKREWFAGMALSAGFVGIDAVKLADDLIRALNNMEGS